jgi:hypothetical protein
MTYSSRFFLYAPLALFLTLAAFVMTYWWTVARAIDARLAAMKGHEAVPGVTLDWSKVTLSGFPFRIDLVFDGFSVQGTGVHGPFAWKSEHFAVHALTYGVEKDVFEAAGAQRLEWADGWKNAHSLVFLPGSLHASAVRDVKGVSRFDLDIIDLAGKDFTAGRVQFHMRRDPNGKSIDLMANLVDVKAKAAIDAFNYFGSQFQLLQGYVDLTPATPFAALLRGKDSIIAADTAWKKAGGSATVSKLDVKSPKLNINSNISMTDNARVQADANFWDLFDPLL